MSNIFNISKDVKLYTFFWYENPKQTKVSKIALNHSSDMDIKDYTNL